MAIISLRNVKGSPLTNAEVDANFINLNVELSTKQGILVSGSNIKTINGATVLGAGDLIITSLPTQTGNSGKFLTTNGLLASWTQLIPHIQIGSSNTAYWDFSRDNVTTGDFILTNKNGEVSSERLRIDSNGKVGIGTNSIGSPLTVQGNMELRGTENGTATAVVGYMKGADGVQAGYWGFGSTTTPFEFVNSRSSGFTFTDGVTERCRITTNGSFILGDTTTDYSELIKVKSAALGGVTGDSVTTVQLVTPDSSTNRVLFKTVRISTGTTDVTNRHLIQRRVGSTDQGYIGLDNSGVSFGTGITEQLRIGTSGAVGFGGANYGTVGQMLVSNGVGAAPSWQTAGVTSVNGNVGVITGIATTTTTENISNKTFSSCNYIENVLVISGNTTAISGRYYAITASLILTLPIAPIAGDTVKGINLSGTRTVVIARNGKNIMGLAEDMTIDNENTSFTLVYVDTTRGWVFI